MAALFRIEMLPARQGDCLWIEYGDPAHPNRVLIDGGTPGTYPVVRRRVRQLLADKQRLELVVVTHVDSDHIGGALKLIGSDEAPALTDDIWFNGWKHLQPNELELFGPVQGEKLTDRLVTASLPWNKAFGGHTVGVPKEGALPQRTLPGGMVLTLLSPGPEQLAKLLPKWAEAVRTARLDPKRRPARPKPLLAGLEAFGAPNIDTLVNAPFEPDDAEANGSSIAILAEFDGRRALLAADGHPDVLVSSLKRVAAADPAGSPGGKVRVDAFKLPHHGSKANVGKELLQLVDSRRYLISTDGSQFKHPDKEAVPRVIKFGGPEPELIFNYKTSFNEMWDDPGMQRRRHYSTVYAEDNKLGKAVEL